MWCKAITQCQYVIGAQCIFMIIEGLSFFSLLTMPVCSHLSSLHSHPLLWFLLIKSFCFLFYRSSTRHYRSEISIRIKIKYLGVISWVIIVEVGKRWGSRNFAASKNIPAQRIKQIRDYLRDHRKFLITFQFFYFSN